MNLLNYLDLDPYIAKELKEKFFFKLIKSLCIYHYKNSSNYKKLMNLQSVNFDKIKLIEQLPYLTTNIFKEIDLLSISKKNIFKILRSSGTTDNKTSKIFLDKKNSNLQVKILSKIIKSFLGKVRLPMIILDRKIDGINRKEFNAKIAAYNGFSIFGKEYFFLLNANNQIDYEQLNEFLKKNNSKPFFIFGFTSNAYKCLIKDLNIKKINYPHFSSAYLIHGGGWKKMEKYKINNLKFNSIIKKKLKIKKIINYYGLIEQTGSIFLECEICSNFICSAFSDVLIRDYDLNIQEEGKKGFIQIFSLLPISYPGHIILTEDIGAIVKNNKCKCSKFGKVFKIFGRVEKSELRGCSDV